MSPPNDGTTFDVDVAGHTSTGTVTAQIPAGAVKDLAGNLNTPASGTASVDFDNTPPKTEKTVTDVDNDGWLESSTITLIATDPTVNGVTSGVDSISYNIPDDPDLGILNDPPSAVFPGSLADPVFGTFSFFATDNVGNVEDTTNQLHGFQDNCPNDTNPGQENNDFADELLNALPIRGDVCDPDDDNDGILDDADGSGTIGDSFCQTGDATGTCDDNCQFIANNSGGDIQKNTDGSRLGDACDQDVDNDLVNDKDEFFVAILVINGGDNCPVDRNTDQTDTDNDGQGDACDTDDDGDGILDVSDSCPLTTNLLVDTDLDGIDDACDICRTDADNDSDEDGICADGDESGTAGDNFCMPFETTPCDDNCPLQTNIDQEDADGDQIGDVCDNCPTVPNGPAQAAILDVGNQTDTDGDGQGDACEALYNLSCTVNAVEQTYTIRFSNTTDPTINPQTFEILPLSCSTTQYKAETLPLPGNLVPVIFNIPESPGQGDGNDEFGNPIIVDEKTVGPGEVETQGCDANLAFRPQVFANLCSAPGCELTATVSTFVGGSTPLTTTCDSLLLSVEEVVDPTTGFVSFDYTVTNTLIIDALLHKVFQGDDEVATAAEESAIDGMVVRVFDTNSPCLAALSSSWRNYPLIYNGDTDLNGTIGPGDPDGDGTPSGCPFIVEGTTGTFVPPGGSAVPGRVAFDSPPLPASADLVAIGKLVSTTEPSPIYPGTNVKGFEAGPARLERIFVMQKHNLVGTKVKLPSKHRKFKGSELLVIEPEYVLWDSTTEWYPIILQSIGDWSVTATITPPEGFVSDYDSLSAQVTTETEVLQFTVTDVGSDWASPTGTDFTLTHKGKSHTFKSKISQKLTPAFAEKNCVDEMGYPYTPCKEKKKVKSDGGGGGGKGGGKKK